MIKTCKNCGEEFSTSVARQVFCDYRCKTQYRIKMAPVRVGVCLTCGKEFNYKSRKNKSRFYCSNSCIAKGTIPTKICTCIDCGESFSFIGRTTKLRCDSCRRKHLSLQVMISRQRRDPSVQIGVGSGGGQNMSDELTHYPGHEETLARRRERYRISRSRAKNNKTYRKSVITGKDSCSMCGYKQYQEAVVVHHIDMDRYNNDISNLSVLCSNCHAHVHKRIREMQKACGMSPSEVYHCVEAEVKDRN